MTNVGIFLADGFEMIEGLTVVDTLRRADIDITTISIMEHRVVESSHGVKVFADAMFDDTDFGTLDALVLPGGLQGTNNLSAHAGVLDQIQSFAVAGKLVAAICAAPTVLGKAGLLDGKKATCYPGCERQFSQDVIFTAAQVEQDGKIITANGMAAALPFSFALIRELASEESVDRVKKGIAYPD